MDILDEHPVVSESKTQAAGFADQCDEKSLFSCIHVCKVLNYSDQKGSLHLPLWWLLRLCDTSDYVFMHVLELGQLPSSEQLRTTVVESDFVQLKRRMFTLSRAD